MTREEEILNQLVGLFGAVDKQPKNFEVVFSKRQLDIAKEAEKRYLGRPEHQYYSAEDLAKAFRDGAEWVNEHPVNVWHDKNEEPQEDGWVLVQFDNDAYDTISLPKFVDVFHDFVEMHNFIRWAYITDLLPKGGER